MNKPLVSITVPVYNGDKTIARCINSLLSQSYKNLEIIVINDGSTDHTLEILNSYCDNRLKVYSQDNKGIAKTRNKLLSLCNGEFIAFCDADDFYHPDFVKEMLALMENDDIIMTSCRISRNKKARKNCKGKNFCFRIEDSIKELFADKYLFVYMCNKFLRRKFIQNICFNEKINNFGEDITFIFDYLLACPQNTKVMHTNKKLYHYISTKNSASSYKKESKFPDNKLVFLNTLNEMAKICEKSGLFLAVNQIEAWHFLILLQFMLETKGKDKDLFKKFKSQAKIKLPYYKKARKNYKFFRRHLTLAFKLL